VALRSDRDVVMIDAERLEVTRRIAVGGDPHQIAF
jgi:YVTN family beta-propeller protein